MPSTLLLGAASLSLAAVTLVWVIAGDRRPRRAVARNLHQHVGGVDLRDATLALPATDRALRPVILSVARLARRASPVGWVNALERRVVLAGRPSAWPLERVLAAKVLLAVGPPVVLLLAGDAPFTLGRLAMLLGLAASGFFFPDLLVGRRGSTRQATIRRELSDTLDQMTISVEAGTGFESAMARAAEFGTGPLAEELDRTLQDIRVGVARTEAMRDLGDRTDVPELRRFVFAVIQAEEYGIPIADVLRTQAAELRVKRRQWAEERAMKIPVKIIFPLVLCIFPTLFIVIIGPAMIRIARVFMGGL